jgi:hypothetical protein
MTLLILRVANGDMRRAQEALGHKRIDTPAREQMLDALEVE